MSFNLTQLATLPFRQITGSPVTLAATDGVISNVIAGALALALPALAGVRGRTFWVRNQNNTSAVTLTPNGAETINGAGTYVLAVGVTFTKPVIAIYAPPTGTDWLVLTQTPL